MPPNGYKMSDESRQKMRDAAKRRWAKPEQRAAESARTRAYWSNPVNREAQRERVSRPETLARLSALAVAQWADPAQRQLKAEGIRRAVSTDEWKEKHKRTVALSHTPELDERRSLFAQRRWAENPAMYANSGSKRTRKGPRADLGGLRLRSSWEANVARLLNLLKDRGEIIDWEYEPIKFEFEGTRIPGRKPFANAYIPDFRYTCIDGSQVFLEVKGYEDKASAVKRKRFAKHYPQHMLIWMDSDTYREVESNWSRLVDHWERSVPPPWAQDEPADVDLGSIALEY